MKVPELPLRSESYTDDYGDSFIMFFDGKNEIIDDAEYIEKAANLYPELVECLSSLMNMLAFEDHAPRPIFKTAKELLKRAKP